jgi:hypothetical protein
MIKVEDGSCQAQKILKPQRRIEEVEGGEQNARGRYSTSNYHSDRNFGAC